MTVQNFKISVNQEGNPMQSTTFEKVTNRIQHMGLEVDVTTALINKARTVPPGSLEHFVNNINTHIANLMREIHHDK